MAAMNSATLPHSRTAFVALPERAQPEMAKMEKPLLSTFSWAHEFDPKYRIDMPTSIPMSPTRTVRKAFSAALALA